MMYLETPPRLIETTLFSAMPDKFRRKGVRTDWADANRPGVATDSFIEGPSFDRDGNLWLACSGVNKIALVDIREAATAAR